MVDPHCFPLDSRSPLTILFSQAEYISLVSSSPLCPTSPPMPSISPYEGSPAEYVLKDQGSALAKFFTCSIICSCVLAQRNVCSSFLPTIWPISWSMVMSFISHVPVLTGCPASLLSRPHISSHFPQLSVGYDNMPFLSKLVNDF